MFILWQNKHNSVSDLQIRNQWWLRQIWPVHSWKTSEDWWQLSPEVRHINFFEGAEWSIVCSIFSLSEVFHLCIYFWAYPCLIDAGLKHWGQSFYGAGREELSFAGILLSCWFSLLISLFIWLKITMPWTQWTCRSTMPLCWAVQDSPTVIRFWHSTLFISLSCLSWRRSATWWMASSMYCPECAFLVA